MNKMERLFERRVTCTLKMDDNLYVFENALARVDEETGKQFFAPHTVERLQAIVLGHDAPGKVIETSVYEYAA